jgi:hypothetical protein
MEPAVLLGGRLTAQVTVPLDKKYRRAATLQ